MLGPLSGAGLDQFLSPWSQTDDVFPCALVVCPPSLGWSFPRLHAQALLFLLYTADLCELAKILSLSSHFYADNLQLYACGHRTTELKKSGDGCGAYW